MEGIEEKLSSILGNPEMMQRIMGLAQSLGSQESRQEAPPSAPQQAPMPDANFLKAVSGMAKQSSIDRDQQALLRALVPYLSRHRIQKLENAMRAARMARLASTFLGSGGLQMLSGR